MASKSKVSSGNGNSQMNLFSFFKKPNNVQDSRKDTSEVSPTSASKSLLTPVSNHTSHSNVSSGLNLNMKQEDSPQFEDESINPNVSLLCAAQNS